MTSKQMESLFGLVFFGVLLAVIWGVVWTWSMFTCHAKWEGTYEASYGPLQGCRVLVDGKWWPQERFLVQDARR